MVFSWTTYYLLNSFMCTEIKEMFFTASYHKLQIKAKHKYSEFLEHQCHKNMYAQRISVQINNNKKQLQLCN